MTGRSLLDLPHHALVHIFTYVAPGATIHRPNEMRTRIGAAKRLLFICRGLIAPAEDVLLCQVYVDLSSGSGLARSVADRPDVARKIRQLRLEDATVDAAGVIAGAAVGLEQLAVPLHLVKAVQTHAGATFRDGGRLRVLRLHRNFAGYDHYAVPLGALLRDVAASVQMLRLPKDLGPAFSPEACALVDTSFPRLHRIGLGESSCDLGVCIVRASPAIGRFRLSGIGRSWSGWATSRMAASPASPRAFPIRRSVWGA